MASLSGNTGTGSTSGQHQANNTHRARSRGRVLGLLTIGLIIAAFSTMASLGHAQAPAAPSQGSGVTVAGSVVDTDLSPLAGVVVSLERGNAVVLKATSDVAGRFTFASVAAGSYRVKAERTGFSTFTRDLKVAAGLTRVQLPLVLTKVPGAAAGTQGTSNPVDAIAEVHPAPASSPAAQAGAGGRGGRGSAAPQQRIGGGGQDNVILDGLSPLDGGIQAASGERSSTVNRVQLESLAGQAHSMTSYMAVPGYGPVSTPYDTARYAHVEAGRFMTTTENPLSTFGADVDTASFSNVRRFLMSGQLPPSDAVRVEEFVNYFKFDYAAPRGGHPIGLTTEIGDCPWAPTHKLVLIGARAVAPVKREIEGRNIVLLIDVSGSMAPSERLPLIKTALSVFVDTLNPEDQLSIVTYAGYSGIALPPTPARQRSVILSAIAQLGAGGSTNGAQGIITAYRTARQAYIPGGVNRVILATDGDFNVGITNQRDLLQLIEREKESGIFLSVLGVGTGNLQDATMEMLADRGNGHYAYLDSLQEARKVLVREADATLETVAKEVKFQVEFNPSAVVAWKLIGYENRALAAQDFNNDRKDGGEMGAGHTVTVLYEVVPAGARVADDDGTIGRPSVDPLRYQEPAATPRTTTGPAPVAARTGEWLTAKVRYQLPDADTSRLIEQPVRFDASARPQFLPFASAVAEFALLMRDERPSPARWDALTRRLGSVSLPANHAADRDAVSELVALARSLKRIQ